MSRTGGERAFESDLAKRRRRKDVPTPIDLDVQEIRLSALVAGEITRLLGLTDSQSAAVIARHHNLDLVPSTGSGRVIDPLTGPDIVHNIKDWVEVQKNETP